MEKYLLEILKSSDVKILKKQSVLLYQLTQIQSWVSTVETQNLMIVKFLVKSYRVKQTMPLASSRLVGQLIKQMKPAVRLAGQRIERAMPAVRLAEQRIEQAMPAVR